MTVLGRFIAQVALPFFTLQLLLVASHEVVDSTEESCDGFPAKGHQLIQRARKAQGLPTAFSSNPLVVAKDDRPNTNPPTRVVAEGTESLNATTAFCYQNTSTDGCWSLKPNATTPHCTSKSGSTVCRCLDVDCHVDELDAEVPATGRCISTLVYVVGGRREVNEKDEVNIVGIRKDIYCKEMLRSDGWKERHLVPLLDDKPAENGKFWFMCWSPNTWHNWQCHRKQRFVGETCWDGYFKAGKCVSEDSGGEYAVTCHQGACVPVHWALERTECQCAWDGFNFLLGCSAAENKCGGHPCLKRLGSEQFICDYASGVKW